VFVSNVNGYICIFTVNLLDVGYTIDQTCQPWNNMGRSCFMSTEER